MVPIIIDVTEAVNDVLGINSNALLGLVIEAAKKWEKETKHTMKDAITKSKSAKILILHNIFRVLEEILIDSLRHSTNQDLLKEKLNEVLIHFVANYSDQRWSNLVDT